MKTMKMMMPRVRTSSSREGGCFPLGRMDGCLLPAVVLRLTLLPPLSSVDKTAVTVDEMTVLGVLDNSSVTSLSRDSKDHATSGSDTITAGTSVLSNMLKLNPSPSGLLPL